MNVLKWVFIIVIFLMISVKGNGQSNSNMPERTPEQEAVKQTEKLQQAVQLSPEQAKKAYEINLKYARERQISNKRSDAIERLKNKNNDINRILNKEQSEQLQSKRYQRSNFDDSGSRTTMPATGSGFRATTPEYRTISPTDRRNEQIQPTSTRRVIPQVNNSRSINRTNTDNQQPSVIRRNPSSTVPSQNPAINRSQSVPSAPRRTEPSQTTTVPSTSRSNNNSQERSGTSTSGRR